MTRFLFPPRPEATIAPASIDKYDNGTYIAQPKLNGSCAVLMLSATNYKLWNRHGQPLTRFDAGLPFQKLFSGGQWMCLCGEYMNKSKMGEDGKAFNHKFVIFDITAYKGTILTGTTTEERIDLLHEILPVQEMKLTPTGVEHHEHIFCTDHPDIYRVSNYLADFKPLWEDLVKTDMYEGLILKRRTAKLEMPMREKNNTGWQLKCRKPTANYKT